MDDETRRLKIQILAAQLAVFGREFARLSEELASPLTTTERRARVHLRRPRLEAERTNIERDLQWLRAEERLSRRRSNAKSA